MISRGPTSAHKTLYFLCSLDLFLFPSPVLRYLFNSLSIGMRLSSLTLEDLLGYFHIYYSKLLNPFFLSFVYLSLPLFFL